MIVVIGMVFGLVWYLLFNWKILGSIGMKLMNLLFFFEKKKYGIIIGIVVIVIVLIFMIVYFMYMLLFNLISNIVLILGIVLLIIYFIIMIRSKEVIDIERLRVKVFILLFILGMLFWLI